MRTLSLLCLSYYTLDRNLMFWPQELAQFFYSPCHFVRGFRALAYYTIKPIDLTFRNIEPRNTQSKCLLTVSMSLCKCLKVPQIPHLTMLLWPLWFSKT